MGLQRLLAVFALALTVVSAFVPATQPRILRQVRVQAETSESRADFLKTFAAGVATVAAAPLVANAGLEAPQRQSMVRISKGKKGSINNKTGNAGSILKK
jgi:hypothetical protein